MYCFFTFMNCWNVNPYAIRFPAHISITIKLLCCCCYYNDNNLYMTVFVSMGDLVWMSGLVNTRDVVSRFELLVVRAEFSSLQSRRPVWTWLRYVTTQRRGENMPCWGIMTPLWCTTRGSSSRSTSTASLSETPPSKSNGSRCGPFLRINRPIKSNIMRRMS